MTTRISITQELPNAAPETYVAFCAACAERLGVVYRLLSDPDEREWFDDLLDLGWRAAAGEDVDEQCVDVLESTDLEAAMGEDQADQSFYTGQALALALNTLAVHLRLDVNKVELSGQTTQSLLSDFDFELAGATPRTTAFGEQPPPPGPLQALEIEEQQEFLRRATAGIPLDLNELRDAARRTSERIAEALPALADRKGWELS